jgi:hypothetical protein
VPKSREPPSGQMAVSRRPTPPEQAGGCYDPFAVARLKRCSGPRDSQYRAQKTLMQRRHGEDAPSRLVGRCAGVEDPHGRRGTMNRSSGQRPWFSLRVRDGTEFARRDALRGRAVCCACCGRSPTNQVGQRGWEANRENRCSVSSMTPPLQPARLGDAISVAET